jgi:hypothetical protein
MQGCQTVQVFDDAWASTDQPHEWPIEPFSQYRIEVNSLDPVDLRGLRDGEWVLLHTGPRWGISPKFLGFESLRLSSSTGIEYGFKCRQIFRQDGEPLNDDNPPAPPMPGQDNLLLAVRRILRAEAERNRPPVMDPEDLPWADRYVIDEDDERFEEELALEAKAARVDAGSFRQEPIEQAAGPTGPASKSDVPANGPAQKTSVATAAE